MVMRLDSVVVYDSICATDVVLVVSCYSIAVNKLKREKRVKSQVTWLYYKNLIVIYKHHDKYCDAVIYVL